MKTKMIGILAVIIALSLSAFTAPKHAKGLIMYDWFQIADGVAVNSAVPQADATFIDQSATPPSGSGCSGTTNQCVSGFLPNQVNGSDQLKDNSQTPQQQPSTQN